MMLRTLHLGIVLMLVVAVALIAGVWIVSRFDDEPDRRFLALGSSSSLIGDARSRGRYRLAIGTTRLGWQIDAEYRTEWGPLTESTDVVRGSLWEAQFLGNRLPIIRNGPSLFELLTVREWCGIQYNFQQWYVVNDNRRMIATDAWEPPTAEAEMIIVFLAMPYWMPVALFGGYPTVLLIRPLYRRIARRRRQRLGSCLRCGYDLRGSIGAGRCPECGREIVAEERVDRGSFSNW